MQRKVIHISSIFSNYRNVPGLCGPAQKNASSQLQLDIHDTPKLHFFSTTLLAALERLVHAATPEAQRVRFVKVSQTPESEFEAILAGEADGKSVASD